MVSHTYVFSSNVDQRGALLDQPDHGEPGGDERPQPDGLRHQPANTNPLAAGLPSFAIQGFFGGGTSALGDPQQPFVNRVNHVWQVADDLTWIKGRHSLKFGVDVRREA